MDSIISTFHLDWQIMIAQLINFSIVVFVLWFFVFKPLGAKMTERTKTIEKSLEEAKAIAANLQQSEEKKLAAIRAAQEQGQQLINEARQLADSERQKSLAATQSEVKKIVEAGKVQLNQEKQNAILAVKKEAADLVVAATKKVLTDIITQPIDEKLVAQSLAKIKAAKPGEER